MRFQSRSTTSGKWPFICSSTKRDSFVSLQRLNSLWKVDTGPDTEKVLSKCLLKFKMA